jgi:membrane protein YdbS with pleckstrin-like domain
MLGRPKRPAQYGVRYWRYVIRTALHVFAGIAVLDGTVVPKKRVI